MTLPGLAYLKATYLVTVRHQIPQTAVRSFSHGRSISSDFLPGLFLPAYRFPRSPHPIEPSSDGQTSGLKVSRYLRANFPRLFAPPPGLDFLFLERPRCQHISNNTRACHSRLVGVPEGKRRRLCAGVERPRDRGMLAREADWVIVRRSDHQRRIAARNTVGILQHTTSARTRSSRKAINEPTVF